MKRFSLSLLALLLLSVSCLFVVAQRKSAELADVDDKLGRSFEEQFPTWKRKQISPIDGSDDVIINQWSLDRNVVSITIIGYASEEQSHERLRQFAGDMKGRGKVAEEADEEYSLGSRTNSIGLRKGRFLVTVEVSVEAKEETELLKRFTRLAVRSLKP